MIAPPFQGGQLMNKKVDNPFEKLGETGITALPKAELLSEFVSRLYWTNRTFLIRVPAAIVKIEELEPGSFVRFAVVGTETDK